MDLAAEMLSEQLQSGGVGSVRATSFCPLFHNRASHIPGLSGRKGARNADRLINRFWDYPRAVCRLKGQFDAFHVADHSYSHLIHSLPAHRAGTFCHDLDTFRCLLRPEEEKRPRWFRMMARHILHGMQKATVVFFSTLPVRDQIVHYNLIDPRLLVHAPYGTSPEFYGSPEPQVVEIAGNTLGNEPFLMHVGSCIARKRIDVLLEVFAELRSRRPELRLIKVGGEWTDTQREQIKRLGLEPYIQYLRDLSRQQLASLYRRAAVVLQPSEAEGFGLPVVEALACGARVVASDLPVLREVGGPVVDYCAVAQVQEWVERVDQLLRRADLQEERSARLKWASRYSWAEHARIISNVYLRLANGQSVQEAQGTNG